MSFRIVSIGGYVPPKVVTNDDMESLVDTTDAWIVERTGIRERHVCEMETTSDLAYEAAKICLERGNTKPEELDLILCATVSPEYVTPTVSCMLQNYLGATCPALDINAACSAFIYMLDTAEAFFMTGRYKKILIVGAERLSGVTDWTDRSTCVIFGDGAAALLLEKGDNYLVSKLVTAGGDNVIKIPNFNGNSPFYKREQLRPYTHMNGQETYKFAVKSMVKDLQDVIAKAGLTEQDIDCVVPHQANLRIIDAAKKRLDIPDDRFHWNIDRYGNTSAASIPLVLNELVENGDLNRGDLVALAAFGGGLSSAACILRW